MKKQWYLSKTLWVAFIAFGATLAADAFGVEVSPYWQGLILSMVMAFMRLITNKPVNL